MRIVCRIVRKVFNVVRDNVKVRFEFIIVNGFLGG